MKYRLVSRKREAVSPVIATILMVAITVVLAATLYMMLPGADETARPLAGRITVRSDATNYDNQQIQVQFAISSPRTASQENVGITVLDPTGEEVGDFDKTWSALGPGGRVETGTRLTISYDYGASIRYTEIIVRIDGYEGTMSVIAD